MTAIATVQTILLVLIFARTLIFDFAVFHFFSQYELDLCRNLLLLAKLWIKTLEFFCLTHVWLVSVLLVLIFVNQNWVFNQWTFLKIVKNWRRKREYLCLVRGLHPPSSLDLPLNLNIFQTGHLIATCVHVLCDYTWERFHPASP